MPPTQERHPFTALPAGWVVVGRCRFGTGLPGPHATGCYALAHPAVGVALLDIAPNATPNAEARLRRALTAAEFWPDFPGTLPVMHDRVDGAALRSLPWVLERGFAALPPLTVPGGGAWIDGVRRAIASDPAWELPGQPKSMPSMPPAAPTGDDPVAQPSAARSRPKWKRLALLPVAFAATFAVGIICGLLLLDAPQQPVAATAPQSPAPVPAAAPAATASIPPQAVSPDAAPRAVAAAPAIAVPSTPAPPEPQPVAAADKTTVQPEAPPPPAAEAVAEQPPAEAPTASDVAALADRSGAPPRPEAQPAASRPAPTAEELLPAAPPRAPAPPVRVSAARQPSRTAPVIDRACSQALFRFQQGERLSAAEQNFIRSGCSTSRR